MPQNDRACLWNAISAAGNLSDRFLSGCAATIALSDLVEGSCLCGRAGELRGRSVLIATRDQLSAALALIELDGLAERLILYPPDLPAEQVRFVIASGAVDAIVSEGTVQADQLAHGPYVRCGPNLVRASQDRNASHRTEWILLTSGTTGRPKMVVHTLPSLAGAIDAEGTSSTRFVWSTFYDIRRYGGLQIFLRAMLTSGSMVLSSAEEPTADFLIRAGVHGVTHVSGTPSHWRRALMSPAASRIAPQYVRLSGEIADQSILDILQDFYPQAKVSHAFASTEAGVAFDVRDGLAGFPASFIGQRSGGVEMKVQDGSLRIRSSRTAVRYIGQQAAGPVADADGFVDTGDMLELHEGRYYFVGRRDGVINVGGLKVHPEEVEGIINRHPEVRMSLVRPRKNPLTGALVVADVVLVAGAEPAEEHTSRLRQEILQMCREALPRHKVPSSIAFVGELSLAATGKIVRRHA